MKEEKLNHIEMFYRILFFDKINRNLERGQYGDWCGLTPILSYHLACATKEIFKEITDYRRFYDIHKVIRSHMSDRQLLYRILQNNSHIEKNGNVYMKGITYGR